jgi:hypothetical protein
MALVLSIAQLLQHADLAIRLGERYPTMLHFGLDRLLLPAELLLLASQDELVSAGLEHTVHVHLAW